MPACTSPSTSRSDNARALQRPPLPSTSAKRKRAPRVGPCGGARRGRGHRDRAPPVGLEGEHRLDPLDRPAPRPRQHRVGGLEGPKQQQRRPRRRQQDDVAARPELERPGRRRPDELVRLGRIGSRRPARGELGQEEVRVEAPGLRAGRDDPGERHDGTEREPPAAGREALLERDPCARAAGAAPPPPRSWPSSRAGARAAPRPPRRAPARPRREARARRPPRGEGTGGVRRALRSRLPDRPGGRRRPPVPPGRRAPLPRTSSPGCGAAAAPRTGHSRRPPAGARPPRWRRGAELRRRAPLKHARGGGRLRSNGRPFCNGTPAAIA